MFALIERNGRRYLDLRKILPKKSYTNDEIIINKARDYMTISYLTKYCNGKLKTKKFQPAKAKVPKQIELSNTLVEVFGLYYGDGQKSIASKSYQAVRFANSYPELLIKFLKIMNTLNVPNSSVKGYIRAASLLKKGFKSSQEAEDTIISFWSNTLDLPKQNFYKITWRTNKYKNSKVASKGTLTLIYANSSFRLVFDAILAYLKALAQKDHYTAAAFLRGLIAADGNVYHKEHRRMSSIAAKQKQDRDFIRQLFYILSLEPNKDCTRPGKEAVRLSGYTNFQIAQKFDLFSLHPKKREIFNQLMASYTLPSYRKGKGKLKILKFLKEPKIVTEIAKEFGRKENATRRYLRALEKDGKIKREVSVMRKGITGRFAELWCATDMQPMNTLKNKVLAEIKKLNHTYAEEIRRNTGLHRATLSSLLKNLEEERKIIGTPNLDKRRHFPIKKVYKLANYN